MRYIDTFREGMYITDVYLCRNKRIALTKNGKEYGNLVIQNKTGTIDAKIWDLGSSGVGKSETMGYVHVETNVTLFQNSFQLNVHWIRGAQEGEYVKADHPPVSKRNIKKMYEELLGHIRSVKSPYLQKLLYDYFVESAAFAKASQFHSAAKTVYHGSVGGLLERTLGVTRLCDYYAGYYPMTNRNLLLTAVIFHDVGKTKGLSRSPESDCTNDRQLLDHIIIGTEMVGEGIRSIPGFPEKLATELRRYILAHHRELEYGSPKKPAFLEALALNFADNADAKMETMVEALRSGGDSKGWLEYNRLPESNIRKTAEQVLRLDNKKKQQDRVYKAENIQFGQGITGCVLDQCVFDLL